MVLVIPTTGIYEATTVNTDQGQAVICEKQKRRLRRFTVFFLEYLGTPTTGIC